MSAHEILFDEKAQNRKLMDLPLKQLKTKCKELRLDRPVPRTKQDACLRIYRFLLVDVRETDIFNKYETERTEHAKALFVEKVKVITDDIKRNLSKVIDHNHSRIKWIEQGFDLKPKTFGSVIKEITWDCEMNLILLEKLEEEINIIGPCESKMIENEHHVCRICYGLFNGSDSRMQTMGDCGHVFCAKCVPKMDECPVCRTLKKKVTTLFI
jgi:rubrerythrin